MHAVKTRHFLQLVLLSALWGASFLFIRVASPVLGPNVMAALRIGLATLTLMGIMRWAGEPWPWRHWPGTCTWTAPPRCRPPNSAWPATTTTWCCWT